MDTELSPYRKVEIVERCVACEGKKQRAIREQEEWAQIGRQWKVFGTWAVLGGLPLLEFWRMVDGTGWHFITGFVGFLMFVTGAFHAAETQ